MSIAVVFSYFCVQLHVMSVAILTLDLHTFLMLFYPHLFVAQALEFFVSLIDLTLHFVPLRKRVKKILICFHEPWQLVPRRLTLGTVWVSFNNQCMVDLRLAVTHLGSVSSSSSSSSSSS